MADLNEIRRDPLDRWVALGLAAAIIGLVILRIVAFGWQPIAPDDARYLNVGLSVLEGDGPVTPNGSTFLLRSPVYGVALALGSVTAGGDPVGGALVVAVGVSTLGLLGATRLGWLLGGRIGAIGTTAALVATPLIWRLLPSLRIDLPQAAGVVAVLLACWRPTVRRWALGGLLLGLTILVKETVLPLAVLPLALVGTVPPRRLLTIWVAYAGAALLVAGWWWLVVWAQAGVVFPLNALGVIDARDAATALRPGRYGTVLVVAFVAAWIAMAARARADRPARLLVVAAACLVPAAAYAVSQGLDARNLVGLAVLSAVALGVTGGDATRRLFASERVPGAIRPVLAAGLAIAILAGCVIGQREAGRPAADPLPDRLATWIRDEPDGHGPIVMPFRGREVMALRLRSTHDVTLLPVRRVAPTDDLSDYLWLGLRDDQLFGYRRADWERVLTDPPAARLAAIRPHPFTPDSLLDAAVAGHVPGLTLAATLDDESDHAQVFTVDPAAIRAGPDDLALRLSPGAATAWLDLGGQAGRPIATAALLAARPIVDADGVDALLATLGDAACDEPSGDAGAVRIAAAGTCAR